MQIALLVASLWHSSHFTVLAIVTPGALHASRDHGLSGTITPRALECEPEEFAVLLKSQRAGVNNVKSWWKLWYLLSDAKVEDTVAQFIGNRLSASGSNR